MDTPFFQNPPELHNTFLQNPWLKAYLRYKLPASMWSAVEKDLERLGELCAGEYLEIARTAEREKPSLVSFDPWGRRLDKVRVSAAWKQLQDISAKEELISIAYKREFGEHSRLYQFAKLYLFHPSSAFFTCPLAMADGAAKVLETYGKETVHREAFAHLTSTDPKTFWTSGQWMTEKTGGSDVSGTTTEVKIENGQARLYGTKWFSSATTSEMALALARRPDAPAGARGLSLYLVPMYKASGDLNHIQVLRLKDKLGTWALPTAELELQGSHAFQIGETDQGVKTVATMLNVTRLYNSVCSIGQATRALDQMRDYANKRTVFGAKLNDQPLHYAHFALEQSKLLAGFLLTMELVHGLGKEECGQPGPVSEILRLMTPVCKLFTARGAIEIASQVIEGFGGAGYIEDTGIPVHLRDSQVFPIWEGATNVLSLDLLRALQKGQGLEALRKDFKQRLEDLNSPALHSCKKSISEKLQDLENQFAVWMTKSQEEQIASMRSLAFHLGWLYAAVLAASWMEKESKSNQEILGEAIRQMLAQANRWEVADKMDLLRKKEFWLSSLKV